MGWTPFNFFEYDSDKVDFTKTTFNLKQALNNNWTHVKALITEIRNTVDEKVDKTAGKDLSTNDYTAEDKNKVSNLPADTNVELSNKVDKVTGKGLSTNDYTNDEKSKVSNLPADTNAALAGKAPAYTYGTDDLTAGSSTLETGKLYFRYE